MQHSLAIVDITTVILASGKHRAHGNSYYSKDDLVYRNARIRSGVIYSNAVFSVTESVLGAHSLTEEATTLQEGKCTNVSAVGDCRL